MFSTKVFKRTLLFRSQGPSSSRELRPQRQRNPAFAAARRQGAISGNRLRRKARALRTISVTLESQIHRTPDTEPIRAWLGRPVNPDVRRALTGIRDHHPKVVLSLDPLPIALPDGLRHVDLRRFLAGERLHPSGWA